MDITKENFLDTLPEITETIDGCDFIAIDTELSGLMRERSMNRFDLPEDRFAKAVESSRGYFIMQFGLSCFKQTSTHEYTNKTYNFYIFPQANEGYGDINRTFSLQAHAIQFLIENGFDFNKLFKHGVSYLTFQEKKTLTSRLRSNMKARAKVELPTDQPVLDKAAEEEKQKNAMVTAKGFLEVLELVILNKKPIVGHNLAMDLIQIFNQFIEPLTEDYNTFKEICNSLFPLIYDTKFIAHSILEPETTTNNQTRLNDLYCQLRDCDSFPRIKVQLLSDIIDEKQMPHQAGYDAYMSGYCFIVLCESYIKEKRKYKFKKEEPNSKPTSISLEHQIVNDFSNKIHLAYSYDFKCFNLSGDEAEPDRNHVFYVEFPHTWELSDLFQVFQKDGGVTVSRLGKTSALCALRERQYRKSVIKKMKILKDSDSNYKIYTYETYLEKFKKKKRKVAGDECRDEEFMEV